MKDWRNYLDEARGKSVEAIIEFGGRVYEYSKDCATRQGGSEFSERMAEWFGMSAASAGNWKLIGEHKGELFSSTKKLPASAFCISRLISMNAIDEARPDMTQEEIKDMAKRRKEKRQSNSWVGIAQQHGIINPNAGAGTKKAVRASLKEIDAGIEFGAGGQGPEPEMAERINAAAAELAARKVVSNETRAAQVVAGESSQNLSASADQKLQRAIRAHLRVLDLEFEQRLEARVRVDLEPLLEMYNEQHERNVAANQAYKGVFTLQEYKVITGALHTDRYQNLEAVAKARLEKAFDLVTKKKWELCGSKGTAISNSTLPKTVDELLRMRKKK